MNRSTTIDERDLVAALRRRDEAAFVALVELYHGAMLRLALVYVRNRAVAEEAVQDAWLGVLKGLDRFEGRSSLKTWIFRILVNRARTRAEREGRHLTEHALAHAAAEPGGPAVEPERFLGPEHPEWPGHWARPPRSWGEPPDRQLEAQETLEVIERAMAALPPAQRAVITLRDVEGCTAEEACNVLRISETNQRVLLHRARSRVRRALERYLDES